MSDRKCQLEELYTALHDLYIGVPRHSVNGAAGDKGIEKVR